MMCGIGKENVIFLMMDFCYCRKCFLKFFSVNIRCVFYERWKLKVWCYIEVEMGDFCFLKWFFWMEMVL